MIDTDHEVWFRLGSLGGLNVTLLSSWVTMAVLVLGAWLATRRLDSTVLSSWQSFLELVVETVVGQVKEIFPREDDSEPPEWLVSFVGTLFLYISTTALLSVVPSLHAATGSLSTTAALAVAVFLAVPYYGVSRQGMVGYLRHYLQPSFIMLPFEVIGELSRTLALAVRLFGNAMSGGLLVGVLLSLVPFVFPVVFQSLELLLGQLQAYIFAVLATVYLAAAAHVEGASLHSDSKGETP